MTNQDRLLMYVIRDQDNECWNWNGQISNSGLGKLMVRGDDGRMKMESAHRVSYMTFTGPIPENHRVARSCGNRLCINPEHLRLEALN
jgi:hypothetical protein